MNKTTIGLALTLLVSIAAILIFLTPNKDAFVTDEEILAQNNFNGKPLIVAPSMRVALTSDEKRNLSMEFDVLYTTLIAFRDPLEELNTTRNLKPATQLRVSQLKTVFDQSSSISQEIKNEIPPPAESLDEKVATLLGNAVVMKKLISMIQAETKDTKLLKEKSASVSEQINTFFEAAEKFKEQFFDAIRIDVNDPDVQVSNVVIDMLTKQGVTDSERAPFHDFDGGVFFKNIKQTITQTEDQYSIPHS